MLPDPINPVCLSRGCLRDELRLRVGYGGYHGADMQHAFFKPAYRQYTLLSGGTDRRDVQVRYVYIYDM